MAASARSRRETSDVRRRLLDATARQLSEDGPSGLSTRRLAAEVGTSTMAVYTYFGGLSGLVEAVVAEGFSRLSEHLSCVAVSGDPFADLAALARAYRANALANPHLYAVMFGTAPLGGYRWSADKLNQGRATFDVLVSAVHRAQASRRIREGDTERVAGQLWAALHGYITLELAGYFEHDRGDTDEIMLPLLRQVVGDPPHAGRTN